MDVEAKRGESEEREEKEEEPHIADTPDPTRQPVTVCRYLSGLKWQNESRGETPGF
jgi:hypothetical protein